MCGPDDANSTAAYEKRYFISKAISGTEERQVIQSVIGLGWQEVHFMLAGDADDFRDIGQIVELIE